VTGRTILYVDVASSSNSGGAGLYQTEGVIKRKRVVEIDFWRGLALVVILIDHIPWNVLDFLTRIYIDV